MKYIFLDVDGVLNTKQSWTQMYQLDKKTIENLFFVVKNTDAKIVLSSSWRKGYDEEHPTPQIAKLKAYFSEYGIEIVGITPVLNGRSRDEEIKRFLYYHPCDKYVIVDDDRSEFKDTTGVYFTDAVVGLTQKDAKKLAKLLN